MNIKKYIDYFKYIMEHKKNVFIECINMSKEYNGEEKRALIIHAFTHDLSKFNPKEFIPYAKWFYGDYGVQLEKDYDYEAINNGRSCLSNGYLRCKYYFEKAWQHHKDNNKHHWDYWSERRLSIPDKYIRQLLCDWNAMSKKFGGSTQEFYLKNYNKIDLNHYNRLFLERQLDIITPIGFNCECDEGYWMTLKELIENSLEWEKRNNQESRWLREEAIPWYKEKFNMDILDLVGQNIN